MRSEATSIMKGYGLFYFFGEAFRGLRANSLVNLLAVGTISMAMLMVPTASRFTTLLARRPRNASAKK